MHYHISVLTHEVITYLSPETGKVYVDATFGGGGHTRAILQANPECRVIAIDWDKKAIELNAPALEAEFGSRFVPVWGGFGQMVKLLAGQGIKQVDGILADFGTSQYQIHHQPGFSFRGKSALDMRMSPSHTPTTAAHLLNQSSERELAELFFTYGQERESKAIARAIVQARTKEPFRTTDQLTNLIEHIIHPQAFKAKYHIHPATRVFQALRIAVNDELGQIHSFLIASLRLLVPGGRLVCISFHSLEDVMVKNFFKDHTGEFSILTPKSVTATPEELDQNAACRSAKLRAAKRL